MRTSAAVLGISAARLPDTALARQYAEAIVTADPFAAIDACYTSARDFDAVVATVTPSTRSARLCAASAARAKALAVFLASIPVRCADTVAASTRSAAAVATIVHAVQHAAATA
jgi:hypothetical protein